MKGNYYIRWWERAFFSEFLPPAVHEQPVHALPVHHGKPDQPVGAGLLQAPRQVQDRALQVHGGAKQQQQQQQRQQQQQPRRRWGRRQRQREVSEDGEAGHPQAAQAVEASQGSGEDDVGVRQPLVADGAEIFEDAQRWPHQSAPPDTAKHSRYGWEKQKADSRFVTLVSMNPDGRRTHV